MPHIAHITDSPCLTCSLPVPVFERFSIKPAYYYWLVYAVKIMVIWTLAFLQCYPPCRRHRDDPSTGIAQTMRRMTTVFDH